MRDQVEEVKSKTDIVNIISEYVTLKKSGANFKGLCPFHNEKTPSFMVNPELQIFKCFGCGESGDVFTFLEKFEGMEFPEALKYLGDKCGIVLQQAFPGQKDDKERLFEVNNLVHRFYQYMLFKHASGKDALDYLTSRGFTQKTIKDFQLGFTPDDYHSLEKVLVSKRKASLKELEALGLVYIKNGHGVDRFRGRIMFPLWDHRGNLSGFAGRILPQFDKGTAGKYINSPETILHHKSRLLFGLWITRKKIREKGGAVLVEGPLDALASYQAGVENVVAIQGTSLTEDQVKLLSRFTKKLIFCLDSDFAGDGAGLRAIAIAENEGLEVRVAQLSGFKDPGEAAISDPEGYKKTIKKAVGIWDFIIESMFRKYKGGGGVDKAKISRELIPLLGEIGDSIVRAHYIGVVAQRLGVPLEAVANEIEKKGRPYVSNVQEIKKEKVSPAQKGRREVLEERLLALALAQNPEFLLTLNDIHEKIENRLYRKILEELYSFAKDNPDINISVFAKQISPELQQGLNNLMLLDLNDVDNKNGKEYTYELSRLYGELEVLIIRSQLEKLAAEIKVAETASDKKQKLLQAQKLFPKLQKLQSQLENV